MPDGVSFLKRLFLPTARLGFSRLNVVDVPHPDDDLPTEGLVADEPSAIMTNEPPRRAEAAMPPDDWSPFVCEEHGSPVDTPSPATVSEVRPQDASPSAFASPTAPPVEIHNDQ